MLACKPGIGKTLVKRVKLRPARQARGKRTMHYKRMPYVEDGPDGPHWVAKNGADFGLVNGVGPGGAKHVPGQNVRVDIMAEHGLYSVAKKGKFRCRDPHLRLKDMEEDGVD